MFKSLIIFSVLALGASAQSLPGLDSLGSIPSIPDSCKSKCEEIASLATKCTTGECLGDICKNAGKFQSCLDCAKASDIYEFFKNTCSELGHEVGTASSESKSDNKTDGKSGAGALSVSVAAVAAGAVAAALF